MRPMTDEEQSDAEDLAHEWGFDETDDCWGAMVGFASGLQYDGSGDDVDDD